MHRIGELSKRQAGEKGNTSPARKAAQNAPLTLLLGTTKHALPGGFCEVCMLV
jgi:hypothetical protein